MTNYASKTANLQYEPYSITTLYSVSVEITDNPAIYHVNLIIQIPFAQNTFYLFIYLFIGANWTKALLDAETVNTVVG